MEQLAGEVGLAIPGPEKPVGGALKATGQVLVAEIDPSVSAQRSGWAVPCWRAQAEQDRGRAIDEIPGELGNRPGRVAASWVSSGRLHTLFSSTMRRR